MKLNKYIWIGDRDSDKEQVSDGLIDVVGR